MAPHSKSGRRDLECGGNAAAFTFFAAMLAALAMAGCARGPAGLQYTPMEGVKAAAAPKTVLLTVRGDLTPRFPYQLGGPGDVSDMLTEALTGELTRRGHTVIQRTGNQEIAIDVQGVKCEANWPSGFNVPVDAAVTLNVTVSAPGQILATSLISGKARQIASGGGLPAPPVAVRTLGLALTDAVHKTMESPELMAAVESGGPIVAAGPAAQPPAEDITGPVAQRWAVIVGVSRYKYAGKEISNLAYADKDAEALAAFLKSPTGGSFPADHVCLLTNEQATVTNIREALFGFLKRTVAEDLVIIHFSGHGGPDPEKLSNLYLIAYDTDPSRIASTGFPMWDLDTALTRSIAAQRVVALVDACHSAGATVGVKGVKLGDQFKKYFDGLAKSKPGRVIFTSSEGYEVSMEDKKWGGGHGVFTWAMLEALAGKADKDGDKVVTLGEMLDYVDITVRRETANEQHPARAGVRFDRNLPMGIVK